MYTHIYRLKRRHMHTHIYTKTDTHNSQTDYKTKLLKHGGAGQ